MEAACLATFAASCFLVVRVCLALVVRGFAT
jgi:hypothetical protein